MDQVLAAFRMTHEFLSGLASDIPAERFAEMPQGLNHPAWIIGHCCFVRDSALEMLGQATHLPPSYKNSFNMGSKITSDLASYPTADHLNEALTATYDRLTTAVKAVSADQLASPNPFESLRASLPKLADMLTFLMTTHEAIHAGQLSAWRRASGYPPKF
ncbi:DinB family protein [Mucisphaera sp.]|uniref:DinB family protein n=1 Tax=Mucisphaera sp. TaxID=2913024 RepID=UPI003D0C71F3